VVAALEEHVAMNELLRLDLDGRAAR